MRLTPVNQIETIRAGCCPLTSMDGFCDAPQNQDELVATLGLVVGRMGPGMVVVARRHLGRTSILARRFSIEVPDIHFRDADLGARGSVDHSPCNRLVRTQIQS